MGCFASKGELTPRHDPKGICSSVFSLDTKFEFDNSLGVRVLANTNDFGSGSLRKENKLKVDKLMKDLESLSTKLSYHALFGFHQNNGKVEKISSACTRNKNDSSDATNLTSQGKTKLLLEEFVLLRSGSHAFHSVQMNSEFLNKKHDFFCDLNRNDFVFIPVIVLPRNENNFSHCKSAGSKEDKHLLEIFEKGDGLQLEFPSVGDDR